MEQRRELRLVHLDLAADPVVHTEWTLADGRVEPEPEELTVSVRALKTSELGRAMLDPEKRLHITLDIR